METHLPTTERQHLLAIARETVTAKLEEREERFLTPQTLSLNYGCFVTLNLDGEVRGCIGNFRTDLDITHNVALMSYQAAFNDTRYKTITINELEKVSFTISVMTKFLPIDSENEIELGRDGLYIVKDNNNAVIMPQVPIEHNWCRQEFISQTCLKAGLDKDAWKKEWPELYRFESLVFSESDYI